MKALLAIRQPEDDRPSSPRRLARPYRVTRIEPERQCGAFGPLEWLIIAIGQRDGPASFQSRPLMEAVGRLFAWEQPNGLANPRLEELRRLAAYASEHGWHVPASEMSAFLRAGWSDEQLEILIDTVAPPADRYGRSRATALTGTE